MPPEETTTPPEPTTPVAEPAPTEPVPEAVTEVKPARMTEDIQSGGPQEIPPTEAGFPPPAKGEVAEKPEGVVEPNVVKEITPDSITITEVLPPPVSALETVVSKSPFDTKSFLASLLPKLREKLASRTEKRLAKILEFARKKAIKGESLKNDDVEKLLHVSHASATNYLNKLVERGSLKKTGIKSASTYSP